MKHDDMIRLGIVAVAIIFGYLAILNVINFISFLPEEGKVNFGLFLKAFGCGVACVLLIKLNRKIAALIDRQK
jgi:hypothetical protein